MEGSLENFLPALPSLLFYQDLASFIPGDGVPLWALPVCFFLKVAAFGGFSFFSGLILLLLACSSAALAGRYRILK